MTTPTNHHITIVNRYGNVIIAAVVHIKDLGSGRAEVHVQTITSKLDMPTPPM
jgi:hypothetical protein